MATMDIKHAFRIMPVHPDDWTFLEPVWMGYILSSSGCHSVVVAQFSFSVPLLMRWPEFYVSNLLLLGSLSLSR